MAETKQAVKNKGEKAEQAIAKLAGQMDKNVAKRQWSSAAFASLITYLAEANGAKFATPDGRKAFKEAMLDSDFSFSSNCKKYLILRGILPSQEATVTEYE
jgi:hypothetical protein